MSFFWIHHAKGVRIGASVFFFFLGGGAAFLRCLNNVFLIIRGDFDTTQLENHWECLRRRFLVFFWMGNSFFSLMDGSWPSQQPPSKLPPPETGLLMPWLITP